MRRQTCRERPFCSRVRRCAVTAIARNDKGNEALCRRFGAAVLFEEHRIAFLHTRAEEEPAFSNQRATFRDIRAVDRLEAIVQNDLDGTGLDSISAVFFAFVVCVHKPDFIVAAVDEALARGRTNDLVIAGIIALLKRRSVVLLRLQREDGIGRILPLQVAFRDLISERREILAVDGSLRLDGNGDQGLRNAESLRYAVLIVLIAELIVPLLIVRFKPRREGIAAHIAEIARLRHVQQGRLGVLIAIRPAVIPRRDGVGRIAVVAEGVIACFNAVHQPLHIHFALRNGEWH